MQRNVDQLGRRRFLGSMSACLPLAAVATLLRGQENFRAHGGLHFPATAKRVIFLHQSGAPSQIDLFDDKPEVTRRHGEEMPESARRGQRLTTMTANQRSKPLTASPFRFARHGDSGTELSELLPHTARVVDRLCVIRSMHTEAINHDPAITFMQTGGQLAGRPSMGSWITYGLGSESAELPAFLVMISGGSPGDQPLYSRLWGSGFLPSQHQGIPLRAAEDPVLYLADPPGVDRATRRRMLDALHVLNAQRRSETGDPEIAARMAQFELAFQMQKSLPAVVDLADEPAHTFSLYGEAAREPGSYAANCLLARRLVEQGVRFVQLYHRGWDHHSSLVNRLRGKCQETDQASAALVADLDRRGLLDDTLVVWAGEFGRTVYSQGSLERQDYGRDHHPRCFSIWMAGGGIRGGQTYGATDEFSYNVVRDGVHVHDLQATILHCLGIDHEQLTYRFQGRHHRLTDVAGEVVQDILA